MSGFKLRKKKEKTPSIQKRIARLTADYAGTLPAKFGFNQDALTAKIVCEGSVEVGLALLAEARETGNKELETALIESLIGARERLNGLNLEVAVNG